MKARTALFALLTFALFSCSGEEPNPPYPPPVDGDTCYTYPNIQWGQHIEREYNYKRPCFNPSNPDEFAYIYFRKADNQYELRRHILSTGQDMPVCDVVFATAYIGWSTTGWIYFNDGNYTFWRIRPDGSGLSQFSATGGMFRPSISPSGQYVVLHQATGNMTIVYDDNGILVDTIDAVHHLDNGWLNDTLLFVLYPYSYQYPMDTAEWRILSYPGKQVYQSGVFPASTAAPQNMGNGDLLYGAYGGLYIYNFLTGHKRRIHEDCGDRYDYSVYSYAPGRILYEVRNTELTNMDANTYFIKTDIVLLNADGSGEQHINFQP